MKRWLLKIAVLLVLGAIVNVAVAWGLYYPGTEYSSFEMGQFQLSDRDRMWLLRNAPDEFPDSLEYRLKAQRGGVDLRGFLFPSKNPDWQVFRIQVGAPLYSLERAVFSDNQKSVTSKGTVTISRIGTFPLRPVWPGFAINTIFYAAILWLLFAAPFVIRRWRRIKRGLCPACAYPVGESELCTECGARVKGASP